MDVPTNVSEVKEYQDKFITNLNEDKRKRNEKIIFQELHKLRKFYDTKVKKIIEVRVGFINSVCSQIVVR